MCRSTVEEVKEDDLWEQDDKFDLDTIACDHIQENEVLVNLKVSPSGNIIQFKLDTGAQVNCLPVSLYNKYFCTICNFKANTHYQIVRIWRTSIKDNRQVYLVM